MDRFFYDDKVQGGIAGLIIMSQEASRVDVKHKEFERDTTSRRPAQ